MVDRSRTFTVEARKSLALAQEEAMRFGQQLISPEILLLGIIRVEDGTAVRVLAAMDVSISAIKAQAEPAMRRNKQAAADNTAFTAQSNKVFNLANDEARRFNHRHLGTDHLLLGIIRQDGTPAADILQSLGVELITARSATLDIRGKDARRSKSTSEGLVTTEA